VFRVTVVTIFPELFPGALGFGLSGKGLGSIWDLQLVNIRDFARDKHRKVDDTPYGGGAGMIMRPDVVHDALTYALSLHQSTPTIIYMSPKGQVFTQNMAVSLMDNNRPLLQPPELELGAGELWGRSNAAGMIILCGRYEGIDQRVLDFWKSEYGMLEISIGDYVLFGGELPAMVLIDACLRQLPGIMHNPDSTTTESFSVDLLEYPQYTRPSIWHGESVPELLLSGNHGEIARWRLEQSERITEELRPDLWERYRSGLDG
jgi:tRNA (guanine37-N1)-methyltransferase